MFIHARVYCVIYGSAWFYSGSWLVGHKPNVGGWSDLGSVTTLLNAYKCNNHTIVYIKRNKTYKF